MLSVLPSAFQSTLPARGATWSILLNATPRKISIHAPREGSDQSKKICTPIRNNFNPRSPRGERRGWCTSVEKQTDDFNPRSPRGERPESRFCLCRFLDFNPRSPRGERLDGIDIKVYPTVISIHAPREGSDARRENAPSHDRPISIHAPREGSDKDDCTGYRADEEFQSTLPARGATQMRDNQLRANHNFNPRSPRGERQSWFIQLFVDNEFQSTLPARGATATPHQLPFISDLFQSTLPARGATSLEAIVKLFAVISIHAPREGSDIGNEFGVAGLMDFNPRSPRGERQLRRTNYPSERQFQSTLPARGATGSEVIDVTINDISIHAPREGSDPRGLLPRFRGVAFQSTLPARGATLIFVCKSTLTGNFNPRSPRGERLAKGVGHGHGVQFQSTLPARGATKMSPISYTTETFQSTLPARGATKFIHNSENLIYNFNPRSPRGERRINWH